MSVKCKRQPCQSSDISILAFKKPSLPVSSWLHEQNDPCLRPVVWPRPPSPHPLPENSPCPQAWTQWRPAPTVPPSSAETSHARSAGIYGRTRRSYSKCYTVPLHSSQIRKRAIVVHSDSMQTVDSGRMLLLGFANRFCPQPICGLRGTNYKITWQTHVILT